MWVCVCVCVCVCVKLNYLRAAESVLRSWQFSASQETPHILWTPHPPRFITVFTTARHMCVFWARCMRSTPCIPDSVTFSLMLFHLHLGLPGGLCYSDFSIKRTYVRMYFFSLYALYAVPISSSVISITAINAGEQCKLLCSCLQAVPHLALPGCDDMMV